MGSNDQDKDTESRFLQDHGWAWLVCFGGFFSHFIIGNMYIYIYKYSLSVSLRSVSLCMSVGLSRYINSLGLSLGLCLSVSLSHFLSVCMCEYVCVCLCV